MNELLTAAQSRKAEDFARRHGVSGAAMMETAGRAVADVVQQNFAAGRLLVLCGPGNNGGDGYVAARLLRRRGWRVQVAASAAPDALPEDAATMARRWHGPTLPLDALASLSPPPQLLVDALFGAGLKRDLAGAYASAVETAASWNAPSLAIDMPSGVDGDSGLVRGVGLPAAATVALFRPRPGHFLLPGRALCGRLLVRPIAIPEAAAAEVADARLGAVLNRPSLWQGRLPQPGPESHKYSRGHVLVRGGGLRYAGAARLAARAALRCGAGLATLAAPPAALAGYAAQETAVMLAEAAGEQALVALAADRRANALVLGPGNGVGAETRRCVLAALALRAALVLDADALTSFAGRLKELAEAIAARGQDAAPVVLTPHSGEFARLFGASAGGRLEAARQAAKICGGVVVLKGADSIVAAPDGSAAVAANAPPQLATAGAGDVLAGMIGGLLAAGMDGFAAAAAAVWMHGEAARGFGAGLTAADLPGRLPAIWRRLNGNGADVVEW